MTPNTGKNRPRRVLLVEDDLATLFALRRLFQDCGWEVSCSKTMEGALASLHPSPDWIILDLDLGVADSSGEDVLRHVRADGIASRVAVVSGISDADRLAGLVPLSPDAVLSKPVNFSQLLAICEADVTPGPSTRGT